MEVITLLHGESSRCKWLIVTHDIDRSSLSQKKDQDSICTEPVHDEATNTYENPTSGRMQEAEASPRSSKVNIHGNSIFSNVLPFLFLPATIKQHAKKCSNN